MRSLALKSCALLLAFFLSPSLLAQNPLPAHRAAEPGRLVGWGKIANSSSLENTLPTGWDAEGFVAVASEKANWLALHQDGWVLPRNGGRLALNQKVLEMGISEGGSWIVLLEDGTIRTGGSARAQPPPSGLTDVVAVGAGTPYFVALRQDGSLLIWHSIGPDKQADLDNWIARSRLPFSNVQSFQCRGQVIGVTLKDGTRFFANLQSKKGYPEASVGGPLQTYAPGFYHFLGLTRDGNLRSWGGSDRLTLDSGAASVPPELSGRFVRLAAHETQSFAQKESGEWIFWGTSSFDEADVTRINAQRLLAFQVAGRQQLNNGYLIGIQPSLASGIDPGFSRLPQAQKELEALAQQYDAASANLTALESRYLEELAKLEQKAIASGQTALQQVVAEEREAFRDLSLPPSKIPALARIQSVYRKRSPALIEERDRLRLKAYREGVPRLQTLQNELTSARHLEEAVEARRVKDELARVITLWDTPSGNAPATSSDFSFPQITAQDRIFTLNDPVKPGTLVGTGYWVQKPFELPRSTQRDHYISVAAFTWGWLAWQENGDFLCQSTNASMGQDAVPRGLRGLNTIFHASSYRGYMGMDRDGRFVHWGANETWQNSVPEEAQDRRDLVDLAMANNKNGTYDQLLALHQDGSVTATGNLYAQDKMRWTNPATGSRDNLQLLVSGLHFGGVLKKDGSVLLWNDQGRIELPPDIRQVAKAAAGLGRLFALRRDGTLTGYQAGDGKPWRTHPQGLTEVVDLLFGAGRLFILRSDGRWYHWEPDADLQIEELTELRGVRHLAVGGNVDRFFAIGIKPDPPR